MPAGFKRASVQHQSSLIVASLAQRHSRQSARRRTQARQRTSRCCRCCLVSCRKSATQPAERRKAASELAQYFLPKKPSQKKSRRGNFAPDQYGFVVDPNEARELRDTKLELAYLSKRKFTPHAIAQKATKLQARIKEIHESLQCPCPSKYRLKDKFDGADVDGQIVRDYDRLKILRKTAGGQEGAYSRRGSGRGYLHSEV